ncbi:TPA_exp: C2H2 zinc finger protein [Trichophyton benhamiae CBS 112371]|uniref:C2H2 zinc finger protein n=1 Tax=Arthroderma benhamiae (strain ATCC MYA-4681 / CBS 112371) TaxID=663331 RepID=D4AXK0_ARTBC|nr:C2H2 zinc finger protein [Trichophyton benhamiae CBS 112371]EFE32028.1 C2H2 zinc finger protein [Trichophyton benhamiae CBS 112371]DAA75136.1 TPA_exp: C2H2 zinc finger protein [Trichophyton benhamiae CBS 112371]
MAESLTQAPEPACPPSPASRSVNGRASSSATPTPSSISLFLKPDELKDERNLSTIANAGLNVTSTPLAERNKRPSPPTMTSPSQRAEEEQNQRQSSNPQSARRTPEITVVDGTRESTPVRTRRSSKPAAILQESQSRRSPSSAPDSFGNGENPPTLMNSSTVASPGPIEEPNPLEDKSQERDEIEEGGNKSFSYPVPMPTAGSMNDPRRGMSLPHSGLNKSGARSPSSKKHRCPYCATEFTRHHNLKSHLLTHSQEKPYVCQTCQSRFRRLHDLKRHTKLHTGERPHICLKCGRRFARGDALARHNKGPGGCAGRRSSMGSFAGEDEFGDGNAGTGPVGEDAMEGLMYTEPDRMDEEEEMRLNLPSIKKDGGSDQSQPGSARHIPFQQSHQSSTYPPLAAPRSQQNLSTSSGGLFPPTSNHQRSNSTTSSISQSPSHLSFPPGPSSPSMFAQAGMTESPKPLSPSGAASRQLGHGPENSFRQTHPSSMPQYQSQMRNGSTGLGIPFSSVSSPGGSLSHPGSQAGTPHLPPPLGLNPSDSRFPLHSQQQQGPHHPGRAGSHPPLQHPHHPPAPSSSIDSNTAPSSGSGSGNSSYTSAPSSEGFNPNGSLANISGASYFTHSPHQRGSSDQPTRQLSIPSPNPNLPSTDRIWGYMRALEDRVNGLESEVVRLRGQLSNITSSGEKPQDKNTGSSGKAETLPSNPNTLPTPVSTAAVPTTTAAIAQTTASGATSGEKTTKTPNPGGP